MISCASQLVTDWYIACGCCVWQSKAMECSLVLGGTSPISCASPFVTVLAIQAESAAKKALLDVKEELRQSRKRKNSSKNTSELL